MIPGMNPRMMKQAMKKMGIESEEIEAKEVIIKCEGKDILIRNPQVSYVPQLETFQVMGDPEEVSSIPAEDIQTVIEQASCSASDAKAALEETGGDLAAAILKLKN